ncbi:MULTISPECIES: hypothetical protein [unclassified Chryseobacterium]|uniref:hypothetical protein n=1 Tax=unclassified Chryseobacterium TaxID=2593645 RepID=UPI000F457BDA|nr:hypothetical protein [Chryseobacterium sp. G0240]ROI04546.1 hypothetical protein EGI16_07715 [Chryseobacterium sp. G0240]
MIFTDYIYYQLTNFYKNFNNDGAEKGYGVVMACGLPCLNIIFLIIILDNYFNTNLGPSNKYSLILYCLPLILLLGLRYWKFTSYEEIKEKAQKFSKTRRTIADILLIIYVIVSIPVFIIFGIYLGSLKNTF